MFVMMFERKKINRKKTQEEERRDLSLSLSLCFIVYHPPLVL